MTRALLALAGLASAAAAITLASQPSARPQRPAAAAAPSPTSTPAHRGAPAPPRLTRHALDRQERVSAAQRRREARAFDDRPLLARLPLKLAGVTIDLAGLAADERSAILIVERGSRSRAFARAVYRRALASAHDPGRSYRLRWAP